VPPPEESGISRDPNADPAGAVQEETKAPLRVESEALEVNLQRTAVEVRIPEPQAALLDILADHYGLRKETEAMLRELNHPFAGWSQALADLQHRSMNDFPTANLTERSDEALAIYSSLYGHLLQQPLTADLRTEALRAWSRFLEKAARESAASPGRNCSVLQAALLDLDTAVSLPSHHAAGVTPALRRLHGIVGEFPDPEREALLPASGAVLAGALDRSYAAWLRLTDPADWAVEILGEPLSQPSRSMELIGHANLRAMRTRLATLMAGDKVAGSELGEFPDQRQIQWAYLDAARELFAHTERATRLLARVRWLANVLATEPLAMVHDRALNDIRRSAVALLQEAAPEDQRVLVAEIFDALPSDRLHGSQAALDLVTAIGLEILGTGDEQLIEELCDRVLGIDFEYPEFSGFTEEWKPVVNPGHLSNIRALLRLIDADPWHARRLLAALVIHLRVGNVFMADTDLFQKDVSRLLAADIEPVYQLVKSLVRLFPVYFNEIGAEGELRDVSTRIDEIEQRKDHLSHFLRKQCHVESNPRILTLVEEIARFWASGNPAALRRLIPASLHGALATDTPRFRAIHAVMEPLVRTAGGTASLFERDEEWIDTRVTYTVGVKETARDKARLLLKLHALLRSKYALDHSELIPRLHAFAQLEAAPVERLESALASEKDEESLDALLEVMEQLKAVVLDREPTEALESIYHKRHIAVGIPSMYGQYREPRFEAMGLILRCECLAAVLMERLVDALPLTYVNRRALRQARSTLEVMLRAIRLEGFEASGLTMGLSMLDQALDSEGFSVDQFLNVLQFLARSLSYLIRTCFLEVYDPDLHPLLERAVERGVIAITPGRDGHEAVLRSSEVFYRELIASSFGPQQTDQLIGNTLRSLSDVRERLSPEVRNGLLSYDPELSVTSIDEPLGPRDGRFLLGYKGYMVKRMAHLGLPTPPGFIITTEAFRCREALYAHPGLRSEMNEIIRRHLAGVERATGLRFGDAEQPLLLSVRSGATISMPGMMDTFLNVGMTPEIVELYAGSPELEWAGWDAYRRFLQFWGMSFGMQRDLFDRRMREAKSRAQVSKKALLPPAEMRRVTLEYAEMLSDHDVSIPRDPFRQLTQCIALVQASWNSEKARIYRKEMQIAEEWGTAVIVQQMVFGNLSPTSGTGVVFTRNPRGPAHHMELYGDYIRQSQGDDVVSGLVETFPVSESQRREQGGTASLETDFPEIFARLERISRRLIDDGRLPHQEIEFTFEGPESDALYILQTRDMAFFQPSLIPTFTPSDKLERAKLGSGIGVGGGALVGRVAYSERDVRRLKEEKPDDPVIVLRPDTVPDDIPIILQAEGLLTSLGGSTSHAAVAAQSLGRTCVVGCRGLEVDDERGVARIGGRELRAGDDLSINGMDGSVYGGRHPTTIAPRRGLG
jgi:pyruvate,orthophosphate dikinase